MFSHVKFVVFIFAIAEDDRQGKDEPFTKFHSILQTIGFKRRNKKSVEIPGREVVFVNCVCCTINNDDRHGMGHVLWSHNQMS